MSQVLITWSQISVETSKSSDIFAKIEVNRRSFLRSDIIRSMTKVVLMNICILDCFPFKRYSEL